MERTPGPVLYALIGFCGVDSTLLLECMSVTIKDKLRSNLSAFQYQVQKRYRSERRDFDDTKKFLKGLYNQESEDLQFVPYYTDGGLEDYDDFSVQNMASNMRTSWEEPYYTNGSREANVVVKSIFSGQTIKNFLPPITERYGNASEYLIGADKNTYVCKHILDEFTPTQQLCVVNSMKVAFPAYDMASCPVQYLLVFLGIDEGAQNLELDYFDLKSLEDVKLKSIEHQIPIKATGSNEVYDYAVFSQMGNSMQPTIWIGYKNEVYEKSYEDYEELRKIEVDFPNIFIASHMRVLLIDAQRRYKSNIDVDYVVPGGFLLK